MRHSTATSFFFFFNDTATTEIYTLSLHDALPISRYASTVARRTPLSGIAPITGSVSAGPGPTLKTWVNWLSPWTGAHADRKSTRLNSSHSQISYAVFCLKKKKTNYHHNNRLYYVS